MDEAQVKALIDAATKPLLEQLGQVAEAGKKIGEMEANLKIVSDTLAAQKPLDAGAIKEMLASELAARDGKTAELAAADKAKAEEAAKTGEASAAIKAKRDAFTAEKLKGVPPKYHTLSDDESKWAEEEKTIRAEFAADMKAAGHTVADLGGSAGGDPLAGGGETGFLKMPGVQ